MTKTTLLSQPSCMPCKILGNKLEALQAANPDKLAYTKINILEDHSYDYLGIQGTPHLIVEKDGQEVFNGHVDSPLSSFNYVKGLIDES